MAKRGRPAKVKAPEFGGMMDDKDADDRKYDDYAVREATDTMARAEAHKADPKMMEKVAEHAGEKINSFKQLRKMAHKKSSHQFKLG